MCLPANFILIKKINSKYLSSDTNTDQNMKIYFIVNVLIL